MTDDIKNLATAALPSLDLNVEEPIVAEKQQEAISDERLEASIIDHPGWAKVKEDFQLRIDNARNLDEQAIKGLGMAEVGMQCLVNQRVADALSQFLMDLEVKHAVANQTAE